MNLEKSVLEIVKGSGILDQQRQLPFIRPTCESRQEETVRPIFWNNNAKSYISKTQKWDNFPNGRWGISRSPAFLIDEKDVLSVSKKKSVDHSTKLE